MGTSFQNKFNGVKALLGGWILLIIEFMLMITATQWSFWGCSEIVFTTTSILLVVGISLNSIWFVPTGWVGFKAILGKVYDRSYGDGLHFKVPFITDTYLTDLRVQTKSETDTKKVLTRNNVTLEYTLTFKVDQRYAHLLFRYLGERYFETHIHKWVDAVFDTFVSRLTYPQLQTQKAQIEAIASALIRQEIDVKCGEFSKNDGTHIGFRCEYSCDDTIAVDLDEDGSTEDVPKLELKIWAEEVKGVNFFKSFDLKINKVTFENGYEEARAKVAIEKANVKKAELEKRQTIINAEALAEAVKKKGEADADAYRQKVAALGGDPKVLAQFELADAIRNHQGTIMLGGSATPIVNP